MVFLVTMKDVDKFSPQVQMKCIVVLLHVLFQIL